MAVTLTFGKPPELVLKWANPIPSAFEKQLTVEIPAGADLVQVSVKPTHVQVDFKTPTLMIIGAGMLDLPPPEEPLGFKQMAALGKRAARLVKIIDKIAEQLDVSDVPAEDVGELWDAHQDLKHNGPKAG